MSRFTCILSRKTLGQFVIRFLNAIEHLDVPGGYLGLCVHIEDCTDQP